MRAKTREEAKENEERDLKIENIVLTECERCGQYFRENNGYVRNRTEENLCSLDCLEELDEEYNQEHD